MKKLLFAIDPGASGATAVAYPDKTEVFPFRSEFEQRDLILEIVSYCATERLTPVAVLELVGGFVGIKQPGSAMFNFGRNFGFHLGLLAAFRIRTELVVPSMWQRGLPKTPKLADKARAKREHKNELKEIAARKFPEIKVTLANADALLILDFGTANILPKIQ